MKRLLTLASTVLCALPAFAGTIAVSSADAKKTVTEPCPPDPRLTFHASSSYVFESDFERGKNASGDALNTDIGFGYRIPLGIEWPNTECGQWYLRLGARYSRFDFDNAGSLDLPNTLQGIAGVIALEYLVRGEIAVLLETRPGVYFEHDIDSEDFDAPTNLAVAFPITDNFYGVVGATAARFRSYPILPVIGFLWRVNPQWTVRAIVPDPRIIYSPSENLSFFVGGELAGGGFRVDGDQNRQSNLRNAVVTYSEYRAQAGVTWRVERTELELSGGYAFQRKFDYYRAEEGYATDEGAPFVKFEVRTAF
ncbi:MAG TPA: DUF6268 family outer membrane beta-barrel protein [Chthoniobacteraceae bacterium]|jgi:hypothetical protein